jgi:hypothetical protein
LSKIDEKSKKRGLEAIGFEAVTNKKPAGGRERQLMKKSCRE